MGRWSRRIPAIWCLVLALVAGLALLAPAAAQAQLTWTAPQTLSVAEQNADNPHVAIDGQGNSVAVWRGFDGANFRIQAAFRPAGQNFGMPQFISDVGHDASRPEVAMNSRGDAIVVWDRKVPGGPPSLDRSEIRAAFRPAGGTFGAPENASGGGEGAVDADVAIDALGNATAVFIRGDAGDPFPRAHVADRSAGGVWGNWHTISFFGFEHPGGPVADPRIVVDPQGNELAVFVRHESPVDRVQARPRPAGQTIFSETPAISGAGQQTWDPRTALHPSGGAVVVWERGGPTIQVQAAYRPPGQGFAAPQTISEAGHSALSPEVAFDPQGNALAVWALSADATTTSPTRIQAAFRGLNGQFGPATYVSAPGLSASLPRVATDGVGNAAAIWKADDGADQLVQAAFRSAGPGGSFGAPEAISESGDLADPFFGGSPELAMNAHGEAVAVWSRSDGENLRVQAAFGVPPGVSPPPAPPPPPPPPVPSAIQAARKFERGKAIVLTAQVSGQVDRLEWDFSGRHPQIVGGIVDGALQRSVRLRPQMRDFKVTVRAAGPGGDQTFSRTFTTPRPPTADDVRRVERGLDRADTRPVFAVGDASTLTGRSDSCGPVTVWSGAQELSGCFNPVEQLADIPGAERGVLEPLARELNLDAAKAELMRTAVELTDGYVARGRMALNGLWPVVPEGGASIVSFLQAEAIVSSNAALRVAGQRFGGQGGFNLKLDPRRSDIPLGNLPRPPSLPSIGGFKLVGDFKVDLERREATIKASLKLPSFLKKAGVDIQNAITLRATPEELIVEDVTIGPIDVNIGALAVDDFRIRYTRAEDLWQGQGKACVIRGICLDMVPPNGQVKIRNGRLDFAGASLHFPPPGITLFAGVQLERIGFGFGLDPTRFTGNARLSFAEVLVIDGRLVIAFPDARTPFFLRRDEVGNDFPARLYDYRYTGTTLGIGANASFRVRGLGEFPFANAYVLYEFPGYLALGGGVNYSFLGLISFDGRVDGEFNANNGRFNVDGRVRACVVDVICKGVDGNVSSSGMSVCTTVDTFLHEFHVGGAIRWSPFKFIPYLDGCKWGRFREPNVRGARAAQAGGPYVVRVGRDAPSRLIMVEGDAGAPRVRVRGPGGQVLESPVASELTATRSTAIRILRSEQHKFVAVALADARPGTYRIEPIEGSAAITRIREATALPAARASAEVRGRDARRVLTYSVRRRPNQTVSFVDVAADGAGKEIGRVSGGGRGRLRFSPAPGRGRHRVEARFELDGVPAERRVVARFKPPSPRLATPARLRVRRRMTNLVVSWGRVRGAGRYEVAVTTSSGRQRFDTTRGRSIVSKRIPKSSAGRVSVRAVAHLRQGRPAHERFSRTARRRSNLRALSRCRVKKQRVVCRRR